MNIFKSILKLIGIILSYIYPPKLHLYINKFWMHIYSAWVSREFCHIGKHVLFHPHVTFANKQLISIGNNCFFNKNVILATHPQQGTSQEEPLLIIGDSCNFGIGTHISTSNKIIIGKGVLTGRNVVISDNSHGDPNNTINHDTIPEKRPLYSKGPILIGNNVWIGEHVVITANITIGDNSIIGANAVVSHDVLPNSIVGGVPAKYINKY